MFDPKSRKDHKKFYDTTQKRNYWTLGYFGGTAINIVKVYQIAQQYALATGVPINTVNIDEVQSSSSYKNFKYIYSTVEQEIEPDTQIACNNVIKWLTD